VVLVRLKFCETMREAVTFVEQGHIRVGKICNSSQSIFYNGYDDTLNG
jgi:ribosomal protein S4